MLHDQIDMLFLEENMRYIYIIFPSPKIKALLNIENLTKLKISKSSLLIDNITWTYVGIVTGNTFILQQFKMKYLK